MFTEKQPNPPQSRQIRLGPPSPQSFEFEDRSPLSAKQKNLKEIIQCSPPKGKSPLPVLAAQLYSHLEGKVEGSRVSCLASETEIICDIDPLVPLPPQVGLKRMALYQREAFNFYLPLEDKGVVFNILYIVHILDTTASPFPYMQEVAYSPEERGYVRMEYGFKKKLSVLEQRTGPLPSLISSSPHPTIYKPAHSKARIPWLRILLSDSTDGDNGSKLTAETARFELLEKDPGLTNDYTYYAIEHGPHMILVNAYDLTQNAHSIYNLRERVKGEKDPVKIHSLPFLTSEVVEAIRQTEAPSTSKEQAPIYWTGHILIPISEWNKQWEELAKSYPKHIDISDLTDFKTQANFFKEKTGDVTFSYKGTGPFLLSEIVYCLRQLKKAGFPLSPDTDMQTLWAQFNEKCTCQEIPTTEELLLQTTNMFLIEQAKTQASYVVNATDYLMPIALPPTSDSPISTKKTELPSARKSKSKAAPSRTLRPPLFVECEPGLDAIFGVSIAEAVRIPLPYTHALAVSGDRNHCYIRCVLHARHKIDSYDEVIRKLEEARIDISDGVTVGSAQETQIQEVLKAFVGEFHVGVYTTYSGEVQAFSATRTGEMIPLLYTGLHFSLLKNPLPPLG